MDPLAVDRELHVVRILEPAHDVQIRPIQLHLEGVLAVERKRMTNLNPADGAKRQAVEVLILRQILSNAVGLAARRDARVADRERADLLGRRQVALLQRRRDAEDVRDIVEAVGRIVGRQHRRDVHVDRQHVADRVGVLGAVQAVQHRPARIGRRGGGPIELAFQPADQPLVGGGIRTTGGLRRHRAGVQPPHHFLPGLGGIGDVAEIQVVERDLAGRLFRPLVVARHAVPVQ